MKTPNGKDLWDKLDVLGKLSSAVVLAAIALFLKVGSEKISFSLQKGSLIQGLITDLTSPDSRTKQDIALIALDHSVGDEDSTLVSEIAERLFLEIQKSDTTTVAEERSSVGSIAFEILKKRSPKRAEELLNNLITQAAATRVPSVSIPDTTIPILSKASQPTRLLARALSNLVYIQYGGTAKKEPIEELRNLMKQKGFNSPGVEKVNSNFKNWVRYFHPEDKTLADSIKKISENFFLSKNQQLHFVTQDLSKLGSNIPPGQLELWISY